MYQKPLCGHYTTGQKCLCIISKKSIFVRNEYLFKKSRRIIHPQAISRHSTKTPSGLKISGIIRRQSENLAPVVSDGNGMFKVSGKRTVSRDDSPVVGKDIRLLPFLCH